MNSKDSLRELKRWTKNTHGFIDDFWFWRRKRKVVWLVGIPGVAWMSRTKRLSVYSPFFRSRSPCDGKRERRPPFHQHRFTRRRPGLRRSSSSSLWQTPRPRSNGYRFLAAASFCHDLKKNFETSLFWFLLLVNFVASMKCFKGLLVLSCSRSK